MAVLPINERLDGWEFTCGAPTKAGTPCEAKVKNEGDLCANHKWQGKVGRKPGELVHGRYSRHLPRDIAERVQELMQDTAGTRDEEALVRWMIGEYLEAFESGEINRDQLFVNVNGAMENLRRAYETREKIALENKRLITPEQFVTLVALLGDIIQKRVSDRRERQLVAMDFAGVLQGQYQTLAIPGGKPRQYIEMSEDVDIGDIIENALTVS
jgi:hypothetical protein